MIYSAGHSSGSKSIIYISIPFAHELSIERRAASPPNEAPYPTLVGTAITRQSERPPITLAKAPPCPQPQ